MEYSEVTLQRIRTVVDQVTKPKGDFCIVLNGSFARSEAHKKSDIDFWLLISDESDPAEAEKYLSEVRCALTENGFVCPNPEGAFARANILDKLIGKAGSKGDDADGITQRMLLLMESTWLVNEDFFVESRNKILAHYCKGLGSEQKQPIYLLNDLIRYFRMICVNYQYNTGDDGEKWLIRNVKLRHSRVLIYAGLLSLILVSSTKDELAEKFILENLDLTPLERVFLLCEAVESSSFDRIASAYDHFLETVKEMASVSSDTYEGRHQNPGYRSLRTSSSMISAELTTLVLENRRKWHHSIFEALIF